MTAIVTGYRRIAELLDTLRRLHACEPRPAEILVHIDGGERATVVAVEREFPDLKVLLSDGNVGPGGGRNRLVAAATHDLIASFDDDSYPIDRDYFESIPRIFAEHPDAWVIDARLFHRQQPIEPASTSMAWSADFSGCSCSYRRERYFEIGGYVPLPTAYGMEEVDFGLRLHGLGGRILRSGRVRVFHDTDLSHHADPMITSASIVNIALLTYLRYPIALWPVGVAQGFNRVQWLLRNGRRKGVLRGLMGIPGAITAHWGQRNPLPSRVVRSFLQLRRQPQAS
jgi:GT2 family glycosyltransferase